MDTIIIRLPFEVSESNGYPCTYEVYLCTIGHWNVLDCAISRDYDESSFASLHTDTWVNFTNLNVAILISLHLWILEIVLMM